MRPLPLDARARKLSSGSPLASNCYNVVARIHKGHVAQAAVRLQSALQRNAGLRICWVGRLCNLSPAREHHVVAQHKRFKPQIAERGCERCAQRAWPVSADVGDTDVERAQVRCEVQAANCSNGQEAICRAVIGLCTNHEAREVWLALEHRLQRHARPILQHRGAQLERRTASNMRCAWQEAHAGVSLVRQRAARSPCFPWPVCICILRGTHSRLRRQRPAAQCIKSCAQKRLCATALRSMLCAGKRERLVRRSTPCAQELAQAGKGQQVAAHMHGEALWPVHQQPRKALCEFEAH